MPVREGNVKVPVAARRSDADLRRPQGHGVPQGHSVLQRLRDVLAPQTEALRSRKCIVTNALRGHRIAAIPARRFRRGDSGAAIPARRGGERGHSALCPYL